MWQVDKIGKLDKICLHALQCVKSRSSQLKRFYLTLNFIIKKIKLIRPVPLAYVYIFIKKRKKKESYITLAKTKQTHNILQLVEYRVKQINQDRRL